MVARSPVGKGPRAEAFNGHGKGRGGGGGGGGGGSNGPANGTHPYRLSQQQANGSLGLPPIRGLSNIGKSFYLNACLQSLLATEAVRVHFAQPPKHAADAAPSGGGGNGEKRATNASQGGASGQTAGSPTKGKQPSASGVSGGGNGGNGGNGGGGGGNGAGNGAVAEGSLTMALRLFVYEMHSQGAAEEPIKPTSLLEAVSSRHERYASRTEQDSHEVLRQLLEGIRSEEVSRIKGEAAAAKRAEAVKNGASPWAKPQSFADQKIRTPMEPDPRTLVDEVFSGELRSTIVCCTCGSVSCAHEPFLDLSLPLPRRGQFPLLVSPEGVDGGPKGSSGGGEGGGGGEACSGGSEGGCGARVAFGEEDGQAGVLADAVCARLSAELVTARHSQLRLLSCLSAFCAVETLRGEDAYVCEACAKRAKEQLATAAAAAAAPSTAPVPKGQPAIKWLQVAKLPRVLTLHLKRFRHSADRIDKLDEHVPFPLVLDFSPFACARGEPVKHYTQLPPTATAPMGESQLRLYAVVEHQGTFEGGHYVAYANITGAWYRMSDSVITHVSEATVLEARAFMLFYEMVTSQESEA